MANKNARHDVPSQVFENFLTELEVAGTAPHVVACLRKTILEDGVLTEDALKEAIFSEEPVA